MRVRWGRSGWKVTTSGVTCSLSLVRGVIEMGKDVRDGAGSKWPSVHKVKEMPSEKQQRSENVYRLHPFMNPKPIQNPLYKFG